MACYLFTFHTYGSWMPDRPQGFVKREQGVQPTDAELADQYRRRSRHDEVRLTRQQQTWMVDELRSAARRQQWRLHAAVATSTHVHLIASWRGFRPWQSVQAAVKQSLTRRLNREASRRPWFGRNGSHRRITDRGHFDHLMDRYLPEHSGVFWSERREAG